jgi:LysR family transcriptional regulator, nod-box dependent transcriptional activator
LRALLAERSVTRAGAQLSLSQPAMSAALARLRRMFDDPLLVRRGNQLELTSLGESLLVEVTEILTLVERALTDRPTFDPARDARTFTLVASDYVVCFLIRPLLPRIAAEAPNVRLMVKPMTGQMTTQLDRDEVDVVISPREVAEQSVALADFPSQRLFTDRFVCAAWCEHPDLGDAITADQLRTLPYLTFRIGEMRSVADVQLEAVGISPRVEVTTESIIVVPFILRGTRLVALVLERLAHAVADAAQIRAFEPPVPMPHITEVALWHPRRTTDPAHRWLRSQLAEMGRELQRQSRAVPAGRAADVPSSAGSMAP